METTLKFRALAGGTTRNVDPSQVRRAHKLHPILCRLKVQLATLT
jgi:hypothetical protein